MTISVLTRSFKGISDLVITRLNDNLTYSFPSPSNFVVAPNIGEKVTMGRSASGVKSFSSSYTISEAPELTISYEYLTPELIGFRLGRQLSSGTFATSLPRQVVATTALIPADVTGGLYFGVVADAVTSASIVKLGISTALTQQPFATFTGATPDSFAVGASGAIKISDNLVLTKEVITLIIPTTGLVGSNISELLVGPCSIRAKVIDSLNKVSLFVAKNASINLSTANFTFDGESNSDVAFRLAPLPGECTSWDLINTDIKISC